MSELIERAVGTPLDAQRCAHLAAERRRQADDIVQHIRRSDRSRRPRFARRQAAALLHEADEYEALAEGGARP